ncbi:hypothetical protein CEP52_017116 [Fusarium oligoseptatum]|uniref:Uncharacterized protein n=1 Tax=Fusarium oligoseptatum TaxID=2604345 RepID=A0A428RWD4_9HYPO|nr:hypothetical protein CEP52_017116 [Fusarium oligoseptatum]
MWSCLYYGIPASIDKSVNQPTLPHAVIVLNATEYVDDKEWDINTATRLLMDDIRSAIRQVPQVEEYARFWRENGRTISSTHDLLKCYYASVSVVRVPSRGHYMLMGEQVQKLFELIQRKCEESLLNKKRLRMLATAETLQIYLQAAFDHFAQNLTVPFDFIKGALKHNPVPRDLGGNILKLALFMQSSSPDQDHYEATHNLLGTTDRLLGDAYVEFFQELSGEMLQQTARTQPQRPSEPIREDFLHLGTINHPFSPNNSFKSAIGTAIYRMRLKTKPYCVKDCGSEEGQ